MCPNEKNINVLCMTCILQVLELVEEGSVVLDSTCMTIFMLSAAEALKQGIASLQEPR
jgi:hypothetical protein